MKEIKCVKHDKGVTKRDFDSQFGNCKNRRQRTGLRKILVTLGGSDTYGVAVKVVNILKKKGYSADIVIESDFQHKDLLNQKIDSRFIVYDTVPSLIAKFYEYDLAITGGGGYNLFCGKCVRPATHYHSK